MGWGAGAEELEEEERQEETRHSRLRELITATFVRKESRTAYGDKLRFTESFAYFR